MLDFIVKYWLEVAFGLVCATVAWFARHYIKLLEEKKKGHEDEIVKAIEDKMDKQYDKTQEQMDTCYKRLEGKINDFVEESKKEDVELNKKMDSLQNGVLSIQGQNFKYECQKFLNRPDDQPITLLEYEQLMAQHNVYNSLGGNHDGDAMFELVKIKYHNQQTK